MVVLYVIIGLVAAAVLGQQVLARWQRSARPSIDRYHRAISALGEMSDHVKVLEGRATNNEGAVSLVSEAPPMVPPRATVEPALRAAPHPLVTQLRLPTPSGPAQRAGAPLETPTPDASQSERSPEQGSPFWRWRNPALLLLGVVVLGGAVAGTLAASSSPSAHHPRAADTAKHAAKAHRAATVAVTEMLPSVVGLTASAAERQLSAAGLQWHLVKVASPRPTAAGAVLSERPAVPSAVRHGAVITLTVGSPFVGVKVPDVVHPPMTEQAAEAMLKAAGFRLKERLVKATTPSEVALEDDVLSQSPAAGSLQPKRSTVIIDVISGAAMATIPEELIGENPAQAGATLAGAHLVVGTTSRSEFSTVSPGEVATSYPSVPGQSVTVGTTVDLVISLGPAAIVPELRGDTIAQARRALRGAGLVLGAVRTAPGPNGLVVAQAAKPGRDLRQRTPITIVVGSSPGNSGAAA